MSSKPLRDSEPLVDLAGAQLGDVTFGDLVQGDLTRLDLSGNRGSIVVNLGDPARPRIVAATPGPAGTLLQPGAARAPERLPARTTPPPQIPGFRDREQPLASLATLVAGEARWLRGPAGCGTTALLRQAAHRVALPTDGVVLLDGAAEAAGSGVGDLLEALVERFYRQPASKLTPAEAPAYLGALKALVLLDHLPPLSADALGQIRDALAASTVLAAGQGAAPATFEELRLAPLPLADAVGLLAGAAPAPADRPYLELVGAALAPSPLALDLARRLLATGRFGARHLAAALGRPAPEPMVRAAECALVSLSAAERRTLAALVHGCGPYQPADVLAAAAGLAPAELARPLEALGDLGLVEGAGIYQVRSHSLRRALAALLPGREERRAAVAAFAAAAQAHRGDLAWLARHRAHLVDALDGLEELGEAGQAGALARAVAPALVAAGRWDAWGAVIERALGAAAATGDEALRAWALHERGTRHGLCGSLERAEADLERAEALREARSDHAGAAASRQNRAVLREALAPAPPRQGDGRAGAGGGAAPPFPWPLALLLATLVAGAVIAALLWPRARPWPPVAASTEEDTPVRVRIEGGGPWRLEGERSARGGRAELRGDALVYTPPADFSGDDELLLVAGGGAEQRAVSIAVAPAPDAPVPGDDARQGREDEALVLPVAELLANDSDADGDALAVARVEPASARGGRVALEGGTLRYTPPANASGEDQFGYVVSDGQLEAAARVTVRLSPVGDAPQAGTLDVGAREDEALPIARSTLLGVVSDVDSDHSDLRILPPTAASDRGGALRAAEDGGLVYTPAPHFSGADSFGVVVEDETGGQAELRVAVSVSEVNDPPATADLAASAREDEPLTLSREELLRGASDVEDQARGLPLEVGAPVSASDQGGAVRADGAGNIVYAPRPNYYGPDGFGFLVRDSDGAGTGARVELVVEPVNDAPEAADDALSVAIPRSPDDVVQPGGRPAAVLSAEDLLANDQDVDGDALQLAAVEAASAASGKVEWDRRTGAVSYFAPADRPRQDSFGYRVCDPGGLCDEGRVVVAFVDRAGPVIVASAGVLECAPEARFRAEVRDEAGVARVTLRYRLVVGGQSGGWRELPMTREGQAYVAEVELPARAGVEYEVEAEDALGNRSSRAFGRVTATIVC